MAWPSTNKGDNRSVFAEKSKGQSRYPDVKWIDATPICSAFDFLSAR